MTKMFVFMSLIWAPNFPLTSGSPPGLVKVIPPCDSLGLPRDSLVNLLMTLTSAPVQWNPFLTTPRIATTVAITTDLQIPVFSFL